MPSRIERIFQSIRDNAGKDVYIQIKETCGESDVVSILRELERTCGEEQVARIMKPCGRQCIPKSFISRAETIYSESNGIEDFLTRLNETRIGGGKLHVRDGKIIGIYDKCYCGLANRLKELSPLYCHCSAGWYEQLFSSVLEKPVGVMKKATILDDADHCEFEISY